MALTLPPPVATESDREEYGWSEDDDGPLELQWSSDEEVFEDCMEQETDESDESDDEGMVKFFKHLNDVSKQ